MGTHFGMLAAPCRRILARHAANKLMSGLSGDRERPLRAKERGDWITLDTGWAWRPRKSGRGAARVAAVSVQIPGSRSCCGPPEA